MATPTIGRRPTTGDRQRSSASVDREADLAEQRPGFLLLQPANRAG